MARKKISRKRKKSGDVTFRTYIPGESKLLLDRKLIAEVLLDCIRENDLESFREVLAAHIMTVNKSGMAKKAKIGRQTLYDILDYDKQFNPELSTVAAIISSIAAA